MVDHIYYNYSLSFMSWVIYVLKLYTATKELTQLPNRVVPSQH